MTAERLHARELPIKSWVKMKSLHVEVLADHSGSARPVCFLTRKLFMQHNRAPDC